MDWIKVTPETMPEHRVMVMVTVKDKVTGRKYFLKDFCYHHIAKYWAYSIDGAISNTLDMDTWEVTHWMPYPEPAED